MSRKIDKDFADRLLRAAQHAHIPYKQTALGDFLGVNKQTVDVWMKGSLPRADTIFELADKFGVNARWLATGEEPMLPQPVSDDLEPHEKDLIARYRAADARWQLSLRLLSYVATEEQQEAAGDVNVVLARIFGKRPRDLRPVSNARVEAAYGQAPHVAARKRVKEQK